MTGPTDVRRNSSLVVVGTSAARAMALDALRPPGRRGTLQGLDRLGLPNASPLLVRHCPRCDFGLPTAQAADTVLTLACQGTVTIRVSGGRFSSEYEPDAISMGLIVKFEARTVQGTARRGPYLFDDQLPITELHEGTVVFEGFSKFLGMKVSGTMDRVTDDVGMMVVGEGNAYEYALKCRPAQRMF